MGPAPLPPHERHWRHPSELAPTTAELEPPTSARALVLATGAAAVLFAAVMVVALTPPRSSAPSAVSATTMPGATIEFQNAASQVDDGPASERAQGIVSTNRSTILHDNGLKLVGAPIAVSADPVGEADDFNIAGRLPDDDEPVILLTASHTYELSWGDIADIAAPDGSIVFTHDGGLLATYVSGELRLLVD